MNEGVRLKTKWKIDKFKDPDGTIANELRKGKDIQEIIEKYPERFVGSEKVEGNVALREGLYLLTGIISGIDTTSAKWDSSNAYIGVGDSSTAENASQTGLLGTNKAYAPMDAGYPRRATSANDAEQFVEWRATFGADEANFSWQEFTVVNASSDAGVNLNRKVENKGTKVSGETWTITLRVTFS